jgi:uncharacterized protein (TIRG00374 family)
MWARGYRWHGLLDFKMGFVPTTHVLNIGFMLNLLPLRAGEVARSLLATRSGVPLMTAATSVVVERMLDTLLVVVALVIALTQLPDAPPAITTPATLFGVAVVAAFIVLIFFARYPGVGHRTLALVERVLPLLKRLRLARLLDHVLDGLKPLTHGRSAVHAIVWTLISWGISFGTLFSLTQALNITGVNLILLTTLGLTLASFSIAVPVSIASIGPFQAAMLVAGQAVGLTDAVALSLGFLFHGINIFGYALWGIVGMLSLGVSLSDVITSKKGAPEPAAPV